MSTVLPVYRQKILSLLYSCYASAEKDKCPVNARPDRRAQNVPRLPESVLGGDNAPLLLAGVPLARELYPSCGRLPRCTPGEIPTRESREVNVTLLVILLLTGHRASDTGAIADNATRTTRNKWGAQKRSREWKPRRSHAASSS